MKKQVLLAANISNTFRTFLEVKNYTLQDYDPKKIDYTVQGIVTSTKLKLDAATLVKFTNLKWIARLGSGLEIIDLAYCKNNNIAFASSPAGIANAVAEHCIAMLISLQKNINSSFIEINNKEWIREPNRGWELEGKTIGLIGYGNTGRAFAKKLSVFGVNVLAYDKYLQDYSDSYATEKSLNELQTESDIISFHVPLNQETEHYYNVEFIASCKKHILLNTARGGVVSTVALLGAMKEGAVIGAALDVLENEKELTVKSSTAWNQVENLLNYNVILTPHIAGYSHNAVDKMSAELMEKLKDNF